ncbi:hypothetical protein JX266_011621 [Neoarthrinium moseri]|nr:hypothetical protein JX266_011621 [Neoarthrinium moseri]
MIDCKKEEPKLVVKLEPSTHKLSTDISTSRVSEDKIQPDSQEGDPASKRRKLSEKHASFANDLITLRVGDDESKPRWVFHKHKLLQQSDLALWVYEQEVFVEGLDIEQSVNHTAPDADNSNGGVTRDEVQQDNDNICFKIEQATTDEGLKQEAGTQETIAPPSSTTTIHELEKWYLDPTYNFADHDFAMSPLLDLYLLSKQLEMPKLAVDVILEWQRFSHRLDVFTDQHVITQALKTLDADDPLYRYWVADFAHSCGFQRSERHYHDDFPSSFLLNVIEGIREGEFKDIDPDHDWCQFHGHLSPEDREDCQRSRGNDADMKYKREQKHLMPKKTGKHADKTA